MARHPTFAHLADEHLRRGTPVFPVGRDKRPFETGGFHRATTDPAHIARWSLRYPAAGVAIPTGRPTNRVVLDVDLATGGRESFYDLQAQHSPLPDTVRCATPSGGFHLYFAYPPGVDRVPGSAGKIALGLDIRGDGGYAVGPPSAGYIWDVAGHPDDLPLAPLPHWLTGLIRATAKPVSDASPHGPIPAGARNATLASFAGTMRRRGITVQAIEAALLTENRLRCQPALDEDEVRRIATSIGRYEPGADGAIRVEVG